MARTLGCAGALAVAVLGCGGGGGGPEKPRPDLLAELCSREATAVCARAARCYPNMVLTQAECRAQRLASCEPRIASLDRAIQAGRLAWDEAAAEACLEVAESGGCAEHSPSCADLFAARAEPGAACEPAVDLDLDDQWMVVEQCRAGTCPLACSATCPVPAALGESCAETGLCAGGAFCSGVTGLCAAPTASGGDCLEDSCVCQAGHFCAGPGGLPCARSTDSSCTCMELLAAGAACGPNNVRSSSPCRSGACLDGECQDIGTAPGDACYSLSACQPGAACFLVGASDYVGACTVLGASGHPCQSAYQCQPGLACRTSGRCGAPLGAGASCASGSAWLTDCAPGLACVDGACAPRPAAAGDDCSEAVPCLGEGLRCDPGTGTCQAAGATNCFDARDCLGANQACDGGWCVYGGKLGASCAYPYGWACASGICAPSFTSGLGTCFDMSICD